MKYEFLREGSFYYEIKLNLENLMKLNCLKLYVELALSKKPYKIKGKFYF